MGALEPCRRGGKCGAREEQAASHGDDDEVDRKQNRDYEAPKGLCDRLRVGLHRLRP
jgi:hypothetical protein